MPVSPSLVRSALADPAVSALADDAVAELLNAPILTPRPDPVTIKTLSASNVWGFAKAAAAQHAFEAVAAQGGQNGALAKALLTVLAGPGFSASDPQAAQLAPTFVGLSMGVLTDADATAALYLVSYRCGEPTVTAQDVADARTAIAAEQAAQDLRRDWAGVYNRGVGLIDAAGPAGTLPTLDELRGA